MSRVKSGFATAVVGLALAAAGCAVGDGDAESACVVFDASRSTRFMTPEYTVRLEREAGSVADGGGSVAVVVVTGDPRVEAVPLTQDFNDLTGEEKKGERTRAVGRFVADAAATVRESNLGLANPSDGSGIVGGIDLLGDRGGCDSVLILSDGLETEAFATAHADVTDPAARRRILGRLKAEGLVPKLDEAPIAFPFGGVLPQGTGDELDEQVLDGLREFWSEYARAAGTALAWRADE